MTARNLVYVVAIAALGSSLAGQGQVIRRDSPTVTGPGAIGTALIAGTILTDESTPQPMRRARVSLTPAEGGPARNVITDESGRFAFDKLPAARYTVTASKPGYLRLAYGAKRQEGAGTSIIVADGQQMTGLSIRLPRGSVITGRVIDAAGEPAFGVNVRVMRSRTQGAERTFTPMPLANNEQTDDRGIYRIYGLAPGDYVVMATPRDAGNADIRAMTDAEIRAALAELQQPSAQAGRAGASTPPAPVGPPIEPTMVGFAPVFNPGTTNAMSASTITVGAGEERTGVDLQLQNVRTAKIEGTIVTPAGISPQSVQLMMIPSGAATILGLPMFLGRTAIGPDGKFSYTGITPGQYTITARSGGGRQVMMVGGGGDMVTSVGAIGVARGGEPGRAGGEGASANAPPQAVLWGQADVSVDGQNLAGVVITMQPGMTLTGRIAFDAAKTAAPTDFSRARIQLVPAQTGNTLTMAPGAAEIDAAGKFTIAGVTPGKYRFQAIVPPAPGTMGQWALKSAAVGTRDALDATLEIAPNDSPGEAVLTFTDQTQDVSGMLQDASGRAAPDFTILVFAADRRYWTAAARRTKTVRPGTDGKFTVTGLPAGEYRLAALTDIVPGDQNDPAFLEQLVAASIAFTLAPGEKHVQDLRIGG